MPLDPFLKPCRWDDMKDFIRRQTIGSSKLHQQVHSRARLSISVVKSAKLFKSTTEKRDPKKHLSLSVTVCDRRRVNRISRPKVGVSLSSLGKCQGYCEVLDYYVGITNRE